MLKGVDEINWFTDHPDRVEGKWKPRKLLRKWNSYFANGEPTAQTTIEVDGEQEMVTFEMFKPKIKKGKMIFNIKSISDAGEDLITGFKNKKLDDISLFIDDEVSKSYSCYMAEATLQDAILKNSTLPCKLSDSNLTGANLYEANFSDADLSGANLTGATLTTASFYKATLTGADLDDANLTQASIYEANLTQASLNDADLTDADLYGSNLTDADLSGAKLTGVTLTKVNLKGATYNSDTTWPAANAWDNTTCPDGSNSDSNPSCGF